MIKRMFDIVVSCLCLVTLAPIMAVITIIILAQRDGPVLYRQARLGRHAALFTLFKFRSMRAAKIPATKQITIGNDPRISPLGHILRQTKLDELPQFFNVLRGDMSFVGPRPETPEFLEYYPDRLRATILSVRPGITDMASIKYRNEAEMLAQVADPVAFYENVILPDKLSIAADYVRTQSVLGDIRILWHTIIAIARQQSPATGIDLHPPGKNT